MPSITPALLTHLDAAQRRAAPERTTLIRFPHEMVTLERQFVDAGVPSHPDVTHWFTWSGWGVQQFLPGINACSLGHALTIRVPAPLRVSWPVDMWEEDSPYVAWRSLGDFLREAITWLETTERRLEPSPDGDRWVPLEHEDNFGRRVFRTADDPDLLP